MCKDAQKDRIMNVPRKVSIVSVVLGLVFGLVGFSALTTANASGTDTIKVTSANLTWGYVPSWRAHMERQIMGSAGVTTGTGVSVDPNPATRAAAGYGYGWTSTVETQIDPAGVNTISFPGSLHYQKYKFPPSPDYLVDSTMSNLDRKSVV